MERYWVTTSAPWRLRVVGSWAAPEEIQQLVIADPGGIIGDLNDLGMAGATGADLLVGRILLCPPGKSRGDLDNTRKVLKDRFEAPETATPECRRGGFGGSG